MPTALILPTACALMLLLWGAATWCAYRLGRIGRQWRQMQSVEQASQELPPLSVVVAAHDQAPELRRNLPALLRQEYAAFEVIVVDMGSSDDTKDVLERLEFQYSNLRHTFTPASARDISVERLALTLGIRTAANEWVVITRPGCRPLSEGWLTRIGQTIVQPGRSPQSSRLREPEILLGLSVYDQQRPSWQKRKVAFHHLWNHLLLCNHVLAGHAAVSADPANFAIRRSLFLASGGFSTGMNLKDGAVELLANQCSTPANTALMLAPGTLVQNARTPDDRQWRQGRLFDAETRRHRRHAARFRFTAACQQALPLMVFLLMLLPALAGSLWLATLAATTPPGQWPLPCSQAQAWAILALALGLSAAYTAALIANFNKTADALGFGKLYASLLFFVLCLPFWSATSAVERRFTEKNEFRKKFV